VDILGPPHDFRSLSSGSKSVGGSVLAYQRARFLALGIAGALVAVVALGLIAASVAGITAYVIRPRVVEPKQATIPAVEPQTSNRAPKTDRHALLSPVAAAPDRHSNVPERSNALLNEAQIAGIERRLRLTREQAQYWPAVAAALHNVARRYFQSHRKHQIAVEKIDVNSPEVQRLIEAALPLIRQLREDQKREVRELVRIIGLGTVASHI
jgi:hypothetical protein